MSTDPGDPAITQLLSRWSSGDRRALDELSPAVHAELRRIAASHLRRERSDHTLQPTALINEAYLRLMGRAVPSFENRSQFFGMAAHLMRNILVDHARKRLAARRQSGRQTPPAQAALLEARQAEEVLQVHDALNRLAIFDERKARIIELKHFGGLTREEIAEAIGMSVATVKLDLQIAGAWLRREMATAGFSI